VGGRPARKGICKVAISGLSQRAVLGTFPCHALTEWRFRRNCYLYNETISAALRRAARGAPHK
jgi:hypothetical protein